MNNPFADLESLRREAEVVELHTVKVVAKRAKRNVDHVGFPLAFLAEVYRCTQGRVALVVALLIYRRTRVCSSLTVTLPRVELVKVGINRRVKNKAFDQLAAAGLIRVEQVACGRPARVTLLWSEN